jgi:arsenate reductase
LAEAIANNKMGDVWVALSAGSNSIGYVHPLVYQVLSDLGIEHKGTSKNIIDIEEDHYDLVVTVCDSAEEACPSWLRRGKRIQFPLIDPAAVVGTELEVISAFRQVRDDILHELPGILEN